LLIHFFQQMFRIKFNDPWVHGKLECLVAIVNDHTVILVFLSCKKFTVTKNWWYLQVPFGVTPCTEHLHRALTLSKSRHIIALLMTEPPPTLGMMY
jgi:hypothetical protein